MANTISPLAPTLKPQADVIFLDPAFNAWDRREWDSLWSMDELQDSGWQYLNTSRGEAGWVHRFVNGRRWFVVPAYHVWMMGRMRRLQ